MDFFCYVSLFNYSNVISVVSLVSVFDCFGRRSVAFRCLFFFFPSLFLGNIVSFVTVFFFNSLCIPLVIFLG